MAPPGSPNRRRASTNPSPESLRGRARAPHPHLARLRRLALQPSPARGEGAALAASTDLFVRMERSPLPLRERAARGDIATSEKWVRGLAQRNRSSENGSIGTERAAPVAICAT